MDLTTFARASCGQSRDTTIWARFVQPAALIWACDAAVAARVADAVTAASITAARFAALHGPPQGSAGDYWRALFRATYATELRVESPGREDQIIGYDRARYDALLPLAWAAGGIADAGADTGGSGGDLHRPALPADERRRLARCWARARRWGKPLNAVRLTKAAFTFEGATRYALWKIERHTGLQLPVTPFRERHPLIAAPGVLWRLWQHSAAR